MKFMKVFIAALLYVGFVGISQGTKAVNLDKKNKPFMVPVVVRAQARGGGGLA